MYVYIKSGPNVYTVGFYDPKGDWQPETLDLNKNDAANRTAWLNGSSVPAPGFTAAPAEVAAVASGAIDNYKIIAALEQIKIVDLKCETKVHNALLHGWKLGSGRDIKAENLFEMLNLSLAEFRIKPACGEGTVIKIRQLAEMYGLKLQETGEPVVTFDNLSKFIAPGGLNYRMLETQSGIKIRG